jgi:hypothetical protein
VGCRQAIFKKDLEESFNVCPKCGHHFRIDARQRVEMLLEPGYQLVDLELKSTDPLDFTDLKRYKHRLVEARRKTGLNDAIVNAIGHIGPQPVVMSVMEYGFIGGSMGAVVGETIARAVDRSLNSGNPLIIVAASGGARMMEGIVSLMQLAKISAGLARLDDAGCAVHLGDDGPDDGRGDGELCHAGRFEYRGAGCADWVRRAAGDRTDDEAEAARGLPAVGVPAGSRIPRCNCGTQGYEGVYCAGAGLDDGRQSGGGETGAEGAECLAQKYYLAHLDPGADQAAGGAEQPEVVGAVGEVAGVELG